MSQTSLAYSNKSFERATKRLQKIMPLLAWIVLITVYVVSAITEGILLAHHLQPMALAIAIAGSIQLSRGTVVFFFQCNPNRIDFSRKGEIIAVAMGLISIGSIITLVVQNNMNIGAAVPLAVLMLIGIIVEINLLGQVRYASERELCSNQQYWKDLQQFEGNRQMLKLFMEELRDMEYEDFQDQLDEALGRTGRKPAKQASAPDPSAGSTAPKEYHKVVDLLKSYDMSVEDLEFIRDLMGNDVNEDSILYYIKKNGKKSAPLEFSLNGSGGHSA
jgi:membrane protein YdbS with pleckstrin-like domain